MDLLTTAEAATYLRLKERKLYELVANGAIPCTKVTGKWLFPKPELDPQDPELAECFSVVQKWGVYIKTLDQKIHSATAAAPTTEPFLDEVKVFKDSLWFLAGAHFSAADVFVNRKPADAARAMSELAKVEAACAARLPHAGASMPVLDRGNGSVRH